MLYSTVKHLPFTLPRPFLKSGSVSSKIYWALVSAEHIALSIAAGGAVVHPCGAKVARSVAIVARGFLTAAARGAVAAWAFSIVAWVGGRVPPRAEKAARTFLTIAPRGAMTATANRSPHSGHFNLFFNPFHIFSPVCEPAATHPAAAMHHYRWAKAGMCTKTHFCYG